MSDAFDSLRLVTGLVKLSRGGLSSEETEQTVAELDEELDRFADKIALRLVELLTTKPVSHLSLDMANQERDARDAVQQQQKKMRGGDG